MCFTTPRQLYVFLLILLCPVWLSAQKPKARKPQTQDAGKKQAEESKPKGALKDAVAFAPIKGGALEKFYENGKFGCKNKSGKVVIAPVYDYLTLNSTHGFVSVTQGRFTGILDFKGNTLIPVQYVQIKVEHKLFVLVSETGKYGMADLNGKMLQPCVFDYISIWNPDLEAYAVRQDTLWGVFDVKGSPILPIQYDRVVGAISSYHALVVQKDGLYGAVNRSNKVLLPFAYDGLRMLPVEVRANGTDVQRVIAQKEGKAGMISLEGAVFIPFNYETIEAIPEPMLVNGDKRMVFKVQKNSLWGVVDELNNPLIPPIYLSIEPVLAMHQFIVRRENKIGVVGLNNEPIIPFEYVEIEYLNGGSYLVLGMDEKAGIRNQTGMLVPMSYDKNNLHVNGRLVEAFDHQLVLLYHLDGAFEPLAVHGASFNKDSDSCKEYFGADGTKYLVNVNPVAGFPDREVYSGSEDVKLDGKKYKIYNRDLPDGRVLKGIRLADNRDGIAPIEFVDLDFGESIAKHQQAFDFRVKNKREVLIATGTHYQTGKKWLIGSLGTLIELD
jgi:hypothetical protein